MTTTLDPAALIAAFRAGHHPDAEPSSVELAALTRSITAYLASLSPRDGEAVAVKALEWDPFRSLTPFGYYHIDDQTDRTAGELKGRLPFVLSGSRIDLSRHPTLEAAKDAAQADFDRRIRSAVLASPAKPALVEAADQERTYYTEGKDCPFYEALSDRDFAWEATKMAQDLADMDTKGLESILPFVGVLSIAADRIERLRAALSSKGETPEGEWRPLTGSRPDGIADDDLVQVRRVEELSGNYTVSNINWAVWSEYRPLPAAPKDKEGAN